MTTTMRKPLLYEHAPRTGFVLLYALLRSIFEQTFLAPLFVNLPLTVCRSLANNEIRVNGLLEFYGLP